MWTLDWWVRAEKAAWCGGVRGAQGWVGWSTTLPDLLILATPLDPGFSVLSKSRDIPTTQPSSQRRWETGRMIDFFFPQLLESTVSRHWAQGGQRRLWDCDSLSHQGYPEVELWIDFGVLANSIDCPSPHGGQTPHFVTRGLSLMKNMFLGKKYDIFNILRLKHQWLPSRPQRVAGLFCHKKVEEPG